MLDSRYPLGAQVEGDSWQLSVAKVMNLVGSDEALGVGVVAPEEGCVPVNGLIVMPCH